MSLHMVTHVCTHGHPCQYQQSSMSVPMVMTKYCHPGQRKLLKGHHRFSCDLITVSTHGHPCQYPLSYMSVPTVTHFSIQTPISVPMATHLSTHGHSCQYPWPPVPVPTVTHSVPMVTHVSTNGHPCQYQQLSLIHI